MSAKPHFCLDCRKPVLAVWSANPKRYLCAGLACPKCGSQEIEDMKPKRKRKTKSVTVKHSCGHSVTYHFETPACLDQRLARQRCLACQEADHGV